MSDAHDKFLKDMRDYLHVNNYRVAALKKLMLNFGDKPDNAHFKDALRAAIDNSSVPPGVFEARTDMLLDTQGEVDAWLQSLWDYIYEDGAEPEV